jgi:hypothetical protein
MKHRHILSSLCLVVVVMFLMSISVHPAMAAEAINKDLGTCATCNSAMDDLSSIPGLENTKVPTVHVREIATDTTGAASTGQGYGAAATARDTQTRHVSSAMTFDVQDPRSMKMSGMSAGSPEIADPTLAGFIANMSSAGYDFNGESSHRYESTMQSDDFLTLNSSQKQALEAGGFAFTAGDTVLSHRDATYYTFTNRTTQTKRYLMEVQRLDTGGNPAGETEYAISPEFNADGSAVRSGYGAQANNNTCFWQWLVVVILGVGLIITLVALIIVTGGGAAAAWALAGAAMSGSVIAGMVGRGLLGMGWLIEPAFEADPHAFLFSASAVTWLSIIGLVFLVLFLYALYKLLVCKGVIPEDAWKNHDWDHQAGDFGPADNGNSKVLVVHDRVMLTLFSDTNADKDAHWTLAPLPAGLSEAKKNSVDLKDGKSQSWLFEATGAGSKGITLEYTTTKPVPPTVKFTRFTLTFDVKEMPWAITTVDGAAGTKDVGKYSSLAFDKAGIPHISYYDAKNGEIRYASWTGNAWTTEKVAHTDGTFSTSLAFDPAGSPAISYGDGLLYGNLMYATWNGSAWSVEKADTGGSLGNVGHYSSLVIDPAGIPHITYNDGRINADLKYATREAAGWKNATIDTEGNTGYGPSLRLDASGQAYVAYTEGESYGTLKFAKADPSGNWKTTTVEEGSIRTGIKTGYHPSVALDSAGNPHISYYNQSAHGLRYASWNGTAWNRETVHASGVVGDGSSLAIDSHDQPFISYYDESNKELRFATRYPGTNEWVIRTLDNNEVGEYTSIALDPSGNPAIAYYDARNHALKYAQWKA